MQFDKLKQTAKRALAQYHRLENYFTSGSFGVKFYPLLMYPCVRASHALIVRTVAVLASFVGLYYLFAELVSVLFSQVGLMAYTTHTTLELLLPIGTIIGEQTSTLSPQSFLMRASFVVQGAVFIPLYLIGAGSITTSRFRLIGTLAAILFACGAILTANAQGGRYTLGGLHNVGASLTFLLGNMAVLATGLGIKREHLRGFRLYCLSAGIIGCIAALLPFFIVSEYLPLIERLSIYSIIIWEVALGFAILKQVNS